LLIIDAGSEEEIRMRLVDDPWARLGLLAIATIGPWEIPLTASEQR
jgi:hypothetical protein